MTNNDVLYISDTDNHRIVVIYLRSNMNSFTIDCGSGSNMNQFNTPRDVFTTSTSLYVIDRGNFRIQRLALNGTNPITALNHSHTPFYLHIDDDANIYFTDEDLHRVFFYLSNNSNSITVAGTGKNGSADSELNTPYGLFVNSDGIMYIADCNNHRIMKWKRGNSSGIRVAGDGAPGNSLAQLNQPMYVMIDTNEYMYISEAGNHRITRWAPSSNTGVCIAGCTSKGGGGDDPDQLNGPLSLAFDSDGSLYVSDHNNHRIQKFTIRPNPGK